MKYRFVIDMLPAGPNEQLQVEDFYVHLREDHEDWDILGTAGYYNRVGQWNKGGYTISGDFDGAADADTVIGTVDAAVADARAATANEYAKRGDRTLSAWPDMTITVFLLGRPAQTVKASL
jgi:hypothetical protein